MIVIFVKGILLQILMILTRTEVCNEIWLLNRNRYKLYRITILPRDNLPWKSFTLNDSLVRLKSFHIVISNTIRNFISKSDLNFAHYVESFIAQTGKAFICILSLFKHLSLFKIFWWQFDDQMSANVFKFHLISYWQYAILQF